MSYFTLQPTKGYFRSRDQLDAQLKTEAESFADFRVNIVFAAWDRSEWTGTGIPDEIAQAAEMIAAGKYLEKEYATGNPTVNPDSLARQLLSQGEKMLLSIIDAGGPIDPDNESVRLKPVDSEPTGRTVRMIRT